MFSHIGIAIATFAVTNIDDLLILSLYFANGKYSVKSIVAGQYLGIIVLIGISLIGLWLGTVVATQWISLLGILPFIIGVKGLMGRWKNDEPKPEDLTATSTSKFIFLNVALVTIANGGDNIGVYGPLFATIKASDFYIYFTVFMILTAVWCFLAFYCVTHPRIKRLFSENGNVILPFFLMFLGLFILKDFIAWALANKPGIPA